MTSTNTGSLLSSATTHSGSSNSSSNNTTTSTSSQQHHRTHSRNISIGGRNPVTIHDYIFKPLQKQSQQQQQQQSSSSPQQSQHKGPIIKLTRDFLQYYKLCNPSFSYISTLNPRRVLTQPSEGVLNDGADNINADYIIYVNDVIGLNFNQRYKVLDSLGQGTFGQVVKCQNEDTNQMVAVKILKNKPAYFQQGLFEIKILKMLNNQYDGDDKSNILRLLDSFVFKNHLCIVFELLSVNLFELIKQNSFRGLSTNLIKVFLIQILDALVVLSKANMIHCDLKPENILLQSVNSPNIKLIDFGSACFENQTVYSYIQSRHYRSPEVLVGIQYTGSIDMWSLGCISAELFLGLPLFPGTSEYNQICRIHDMKGPFSNDMLDRGKNTLQYFNKKIENGKSVYTLKTEEEYSKETKQTLPTSKKYFNYKLLPDIIQNYSFKKNLSPQEMEKEKYNRKVFADFVQGLLELDPNERWSAMQAKEHPFITGAPFTEPFQPDPAKKRPFATTAPKPIPTMYQSHSGGGSGSFNSGSTSASSSSSSYGKKMVPPLSFKHSLSDQFNFPESYSPRGLYGPFGANSQPSQLALGQSPSLFGNPSSVYPPLPFSPLYPPPNSSYFGGGNSWSERGDVGNNRRGRSKSDIPSQQQHQQQQQQQQQYYQFTMMGMSGNELLPSASLGDDMSGQYTEDKPPIYPLNSPQRKRSQSGHVQLDSYNAGGGGGYPIPYVPNVYSNNNNNGQNRYRSLSYGEQQQQQHMQQQHHYHQQQQQPQQMGKVQHSPVLLQHSAPQMFDLQPLTPQLLSQQDPNMSPALMSSDGLLYDRSPSEEMLFPLEVSSSQQTPQLSSQQQQQKNNNSPLGTRHYPQYPYDPLPGISSLQLVDNQNNQNTGSGHQQSSPWGIPFTIQNSDGFDDSNIIGFSPYMTPMYQQTSPSNQSFNNNNNSFKNSPPTRQHMYNQQSELSNSSSNLFNNTQQQQHHHSFSYTTSSSSYSGSHPHSYSAPSKPQHQYQQQLQQSPPSSYSILQHKPQQQQQQQVKNRPRNDAFSRTSPPTQRSHQQTHSFNNNNNNSHYQQPPSQQQQQQNKPLSLSQTMNNPNYHHHQQQQQQQQQHIFSSLPNTPPFTPQSHLNAPPPNLNSIDNRIKDIDYQNPNSTTEQTNPLSTSQNRKLLIGTSRSNLEQHPGAH